MKMFKLLVLLVLSLSLFSVVSGEVVSGEVVSRNDITKSGWEFSEVGKSKWYPAETPGSVHTDLIANKVIEDPFFRDNEKKIQWIGKTDWEYRTKFNYSAGDLSKSRIEMVFESLDTYAIVKLNGKQILSADNMFRTWRVDVKPHLKAGENTMSIVFRSPINEILPRMKKIDYQIPAPNDQGEITSPYTRKAPYHFGWDWGPRLVTAGIARPITIEAWNSVRIENAQFVQHKLAKDVADLSFNLELESAKDTDISIRLINTKGNDVMAEERVSVKKGTNMVPIKFKVQNPKLWYPAGLGEQNLYRFRMEVRENGNMVDEETERIGLRTVELRQVKDKWGKSFTFVVNGIPVFGKGGNWIPADSFQTRVSKEKYRHLMTSFRDANMNMVRVWGGGIYEDDYFYELADELGLMVWQDFMFGVSMYPGDQPFLDSIREEAIDNVKRLRNYPSIVLWCGNNESEIAWKHWGWKDRLPDVLWENYKKIFLRILPEVVENHDPSREYWSSSPSSDLEEDPQSQKSGDVHYWDVWHAEKPFVEYTKQNPRFMSEYGFQSFPDIETVREYTIAEDRKSIETPVMLAHQRHPRGNQLIREYMLREYEEPKDFESFLYVSQVLQAEGIRIGTEHFRRNTPRTMGALYWQLNDCWPVASWSGTDYFGRWKAMHYYAKRFFEPLMVSSFIDGDDINVYIVSDYPTKEKVELEVSVLDIRGNVLSREKKSLVADGIVGKKTFTASIRDVAEGRKKSELIFATRLFKNGKEVSSSNVYLVPFKDAGLPKPNIRVQSRRTQDGIEIRLSTDVLARAVRLSGFKKGFFENNYFDLIPGEAKVLTYKPKRKMTLAQFRNKLKVNSLFDAFD